MKKKGILNLKIVIFLALAISFFSYSSDITLGVPLPEPASGYFVQHGTVNMSTLVMDINITPVNAINRSFVIVHQWHNQLNTGATAATNTASAMVSAYLMNESVIRLERGATANIYVTWMVVEALSEQFFVQQGNISVSGLGLSINDTIPKNVNVANSFAWVTFNTTYGSNDADDIAFFANISSPNKINISRGNASAVFNGRFRWTVVEWNLSKISSFQKGTISLTGNETRPGSRNQSLTTTIVKNQSFLFSQCITIGGGATIAPYLFFTSAFIRNDTTLSFYSNGTASARKCMWAVIDFGPKSLHRIEGTFTFPTNSGTAQIDGFGTNIIQPNNSLVYTDASIIATTATRFPAGSLYYSINSTAIIYNRTYTRLGQVVDWQVLELPFNYFPNVTSLNYPNEGDNVSNKSIGFNFTVSDKIGNLTNCSLWGNFTSSVFLENNSIQNPSNTSINTINVTLNSDGDYKWSIKCFDDYSDSDFFDSNFTFTLDATPPQITNPKLNQTVLNQTHAVRLNVTITDAHNIISYSVNITNPNNITSNLPLSYDTGNNYYIIFDTTTINGTYNFSKIIATDSFGNTNVSNFYNLTFNVTISPPRLFNLSLPRNATESKDRTPTMFWNETYDEHFTNYTLLLSLTSDFSLISQQPSTFNVSDVNLTLSTLSIDQIYYWKVLAYDIFGSMTESTDTFVYITDNTEPTISLVTPIDDSFVITNIASFNFTPNDLRTIDTCVLYTNVSGSFLPNVSNTTLNLNKGSTNLLSTNLNEGIYLWNIFCNDSAGNGAFAIANKTIKVDLTPPNITLFYPNNSHYENVSTTVNISFIVSDKWADIDYCEFIIDDVFKEPNISVQNNVLKNIQRSFIAGNHTWWINCTDVNGFENSSEKRNITIEDIVDRTPPLIDIVYPTSDYLPNNEFLVRYIPKDTGILNCSIYINDSIFNKSYNVTPSQENYFNLTGLSELYYNWTIECFDNMTPSNGAKKQPIMNFTIDLTNPSFLPDSLYPLNNSYISSNVVTFEFIPNDTNIDYCELYRNSTSGWGEVKQNLSLQDLINTTFTDTIPDGVYIWNILCFDKSGRSSFYDYNYTINIDTTGPNYVGGRIISPISGSAYSKTGKYDFNTTWVDNSFIDTIIFENNFSGNPINETLTHLGSGLYRFNITSIPVGNFYYKWYANDTLGNKFETIKFDYEVVKAVPLINISFNGTNSDITINQSQTLNVTTFISESDNTYLTLYLYQSDLYPEGIMINNGSTQLENITLFSEPGIYNFTSYYYESYNYTNGSTSRIVTVNDITPPNISITKPTNNTIVGAKSVSFEYSANDHSIIQYCELYIDDLYNDTHAPITNDELKTFTKTPYNGSHSFQIKCLDEKDNLGVSEIINFTFFPTPSLTVTITNNRLRYTDNFLVNSTILVYATQTLVGANVTSDIIFGNTSTPWWNNSWALRKPLFMSDTIGLTHPEWIQINITGLLGNISNCTKEIRVIDSTDFNQTIVPVRIISFTNSSCFIEFNANITANAINETNYYVYYNNSAAADPGFTFSPISMSVQRGQINRAPGLTNITTSIINVDTSKSFLLFDSLSNGSTPALGMFTAELKSNSINFSRYTGSATANISWQIISHPWIEVQRGSVSMVTGQNETNITISDVNRSRSFIIVNGRADSTTVGGFHFGYTTANFINSTTIRLRRDSSVAVASIVDYQVVEWFGSQVQNGSATMTAAASATSTLSPNIDQTKTFLIFSKRETSTATQVARELVHGVITNQNTLTFNRITPTGNVAIEYFTISLTKGGTVSQYLSSIPSASLIVNQTIATIDVNKTFFVYSTNASGAVTALNQSYLLTNITNSTNLRFIKQATGSILNPAIYVIQINLTNISIISFGTQENWVDLNIEINKTNNVGNYSFIWNTTNSPFGNYSLVSKASTADYEGGIGHSHFELIQDLTPPNITVTLPVNTYNTTIGIINFSFTAKDEFSTFINCSINLNGTIYKINTTHGNVTNITIQTNASIQNLTPSHYYWNITCSDEKGNPHTNTTFNFTIIGKPTLLNVTYNSTDNKSIILSWSAGIGADVYDIYVKTNFNSNFTPTPYASGIIGLTWQDNTTNSTLEKYYAVSSRRGKVNLTGDVIGAKKEMEIHVEKDVWALVSFPFNITHKTLGAFPANKNPILISPRDAITRIYTFNGTAKKWDSADWKNSSFNESSGWDSSVGVSSIEPGKGYWLEMNSNATIIYYGVVINDSFNVSIYEGWNLIGPVFPGQQDLPYTDEPPFTPLLLTPNNSLDYLYQYNESLPSGFKDIQHFFPFGWGWSGEPVQQQFELTSGYYAKANANATWMVGK